MADPRGPLGMLFPLFNFCHFHVAFLGQKPYQIIVFAPKSVVGGTLQRQRKILDLPLIRLHGELSRINDRTFRQGRLSGLEIKWNRLAEEIKTIKDLF